MRFDCIFFDSGGTLYKPGTDCDPSPDQVASRNTKRVHALLKGMQVDMDPRHLETSLAKQEELCQQELGQSYNFMRLMDSVVKDLHLPLGPEDAACLADAYAGPRYASWLFPGTQSALRTLHDSGHKLGIVANTTWPGFSMDRAFAGVGLLPFLSIRLYSGDLGIAKPEPAIFRLAERIAGLEGRGKRILYVGNDLEADVKGALAAGWSVAFRREDRATTGGLADLEFDHISELVAYCLDP